MSRWVRSFPAIDEAPVRVLTCDDMPELRELLRYFVDRDDGTRMVGEAADGWQAIRAAGAVSAEVLVLDLGMPGPPPVELLAALRRAAPHTAIALYSGTPAHVLGPHRRALALEIAKGTPPAVVVDRVRELGRARRRVAAPVP
jgi:DNA-binding NarL/FixJ family response regulator